MGNEISTVGGAIATAATSVAAGVTLGQVEVLNEAVKDCANFTATKASETIVRHAGETVVNAGAMVVAGVSGKDGMWDEYREKTVNAAVATAKESAKAVDSYTDVVPVVGHAKGGILYVIGEEAKGARAIMASSRATGTILGGVGGALIGGPAGAIAGGIAGGAAMDGLTTGIDSAIHRQFRPSGHIQAWHRALHSHDKMTRIEGVVQTMAIPAFDALGGRGAGHSFQTATTQMGGITNALQPKLLRPRRLQAPHNNTNNDDDDNDDVISKASL